MKKKPNRKPNHVCRICQKPFYGSPCRTHQTCSLACRTEYYREIGNLLTGGLRGAKNHRWKGGRWLHQGKYWLVLRPDHPRADRHGYVREHRLVMEEHLGRLLLRTEVVHHRNGDTQDNRIENLRLFPTNGEHKHTEYLEGVSSPSASEC